MAVRVNTLGKSAILNRQLNSSYDVVEYVADNMPLLLDLVKKFDTLKIVRDIYDIINHVANQEIHLTEEQVNSLNQIGTISAALEQAGINVSGLTNQLTALSNSLQQHINNNVIHVTDEDKTLWNSYADTLQALTDLINQVNNKDIDYNDLKNKPVLQHITVDSALDSTSRNPLENRAIVNELSNYPTRSNISRVGFTGQYRDLVGIPALDTMLDSTSTNGLTNQCITEAIENLSASIANAGLTEAQVRAIIQSELSAYKLDLFTIVSVLPQSGEEGIAYLVPIQGQNLKFNIYTWEVIDDTTTPPTYGFAQFGGGTVTIDLSNYYTKSETDSLLNNKAASSHTHTTSDISNFPTIPTKTSDLTNDNGFITGVSWNDVSNKPTLSTVAISGSYNDLSNKPTIPTVNNATLTIQKNGTNVATFTSNSNTDVTANITVPTKVSDLTNDSGFLTLESLGANSIPFHNTYPRCKYLGTSITDAQNTAIKNRTYDDLFIGDYWTINGVNWRIVAIDYYYNVGDTNFDKGNVIVMPDDILYSAQMNETNTTAGAYAGSLMRTQNLNNARTIAQNAFGSHLANHRILLANSVDTSGPNNWAWYDSDGVELPNEVQIYGTRVWGSALKGFDVATQKQQFPLMLLAPQFVNIRQSYWLQDVSSRSVSIYFAFVYSAGNADNVTASNSFGVRPSVTLSYI